MYRTLLVVSASALLVAAAGCSDRGGERQGERRVEGNVGQQTTAQAIGTTVTGELVSANRDEIVLKEQGKDEELKLKVDDSTQVLIDGREATIDSLREGAQVRASFDASQADRRATRIEAMGGAGGTAADQPGGSAGTTGGLGGASSHTPGQMGGPGGESATSAGDPGAPRGEAGKGEAPKADQK